MIRIISAVLLTIVSGCADSAGNRQKDTETETRYSTDKTDTDDTADPNKSCIKVSCAKPPENKCEDIDNLIVFNPYGWCEQGECVYAARKETCMGGPCESDSCSKSPCQGVGCYSPPMSGCTPNSEFRAFNSFGNCSVIDGKPWCTYAYLDSPCANGCADNKCVEDDACEHVTCDTPFANYCADDKTLVTGNEHPRCSNGECLYAMRTISCELGCQDGSCVGDLKCGNVICDKPPAAYCLNDTTLRAFESNGGCNKGACIHKEVDLHCKDGCNGGRCVNEPCAGVFCDKIPVSFCVDDQQLSFWDRRPATCVQGVCQYGLSAEICDGGCSDGQCADNPCVGVFCQSPPASFCNEDGTLAYFMGACNEQDGGCEYTRLEKVCPLGCELGACVVEETDTGDDTETASDTQGSSDSFTISDTLVIGDAREGGLVATENGIVLTVDDDSLDAGSTVFVTDAQYDTIETGGIIFNVVFGFEISMVGTADSPPVIRFPNNDKLTEDQRLLLVEMIAMKEGVTLNLVGTLKVTNEGAFVESDNTGDSARFQGAFGVNESGTYLAVYEEEPLGFAFGRVVKKSDGAPAVGVYVQSNSGIFTGFTDTDGYFALGGSFGTEILFVSDPASTEHASAVVVLGDVDQIVDFQLAAPVPVDGRLPNGCFDAPDLSAYSKQGNAGVSASLDSIAPLQGDGMLLMTTGEGAESDARSELSITFTVPAGVTSVSFSYLFLSDEFPSHLDEAELDRFYALTHRVDESTLVVEAYAAAGLDASGTVYGGQTAWTTVSIDVSSFAGSADFITLSLVITDAADTEIDSAVLIDNLHFDNQHCEGV